MELLCLPDEMIVLIGEFLDPVSTVRFSRTCWRAYKYVITNYDVLTRRVKAMCEEIRAIKYDVYPRDLARADQHGKYCGVREIHGRLVGSIGRITHTRKYSNSLGYIRQRGVDDVIIFSDKLRMTTVDDDFDDEDNPDFDCDRYAHCRQIGLFSGQKQTDTVYTVYEININVTHEDIIRTRIDDIIDHPRKYNDVTIYSKTPWIEKNGDLAWYP